MANQFRAFRPLAATLSATPDGLVASTITLNYNLGVRAVRLCNIGTQTVFVLLREAGDATAATALNGIPVPAGQTELFTLPLGITTLSVFSAAAGSSIYATIGEGI